MVKSVKTTKTYKLRCRVLLARTTLCTDKHHLDSCALIFILLVEFGEASCSFCCCDRVKQNATSKS